MTTMTLDQAKTHLDDLLARAASGEKVVIVRDDGSTFSVVPDPVFDGSPIPTPSKTSLGEEPDTRPVDVATNLELPTQPVSRRQLRGILKGKIWMAPDFDDIPEGFEPYLGDDYEKTR